MYVLRMYHYHGTKVAAFLGGFAKRVIVLIADFGILPFELETPMHTLIKWGLVVVGVIIIIISQGIFSLQSTNLHVNWSLHMHFR